VKAVREALKNMPNGLDSAYKEAMERINRRSEDDKMLAHSALAWVLNAKRPLDASELREPLAVEPGTKRLDPENLLEIEVVLSVCAGLVIVDQTHTVWLIHYTVQHYLDCTKEIYFPTAQLDITRTCLTYLSFPVFDDLGPDPVPRSTLMDLTGTHPLFDYAVKYGLIHAHGEPELIMREALLVFLANASRWTHMWVSQHDFVTLGIRWSTTRLGIAAFFDLREITRGPPSYSDARKPRWWHCASGRRIEQPPGDDSPPHRKWCGCESTGQTWWLEAASRIQGSCCYGHRQGGRC
jgi:hypothetical protein